MIAEAHGVTATLDRANASLVDIALHQRCGIVTLGEGQDKLEDIQVVLAPCEFF